MKKVFYSTPYCVGDIGKGINDFVELLPEDCWVVIRDADTLFLTSDQQMQIQMIAESNPDFDLITCRTNRLKSPMQAVEGAFDVDSMAWHVSLAKELEKKYYGLIEPLDEPHVAAGIFLMFRKSLWNDFKFENRTIQFDIKYSETLHKEGKKIGVAQGIYLFHLYRYGSADPFREIGHLLDCHDFKK